MKNELRSRLAPYGQQHLLDFWDELDEAARRRLAEQIRGIDFALIRRLYERRDDVADYRKLAELAGPPPGIRLDDAACRFSPDDARRRGEAALRAGRVGAILVAGGQGTRLGFEHPKGTFPIGPVSGNSLFQIHVEKILARAGRFGASLPLYLMTSPATHEETVAFFAEHDRFGLAQDDLRVFCQGTMPAVDAATGRVLLAEKGSLALSPDGHGGALAALAGSGALDDIERRGVRHLFYFQVDNPLVDVGAPEMIGYHLLFGSEMTTQVIAKREPLERVGNVVEVGGRLRVIEYSDLPDDVAHRRNPDGSLRIWAGSIGVHVFEASFLRRMAAVADGLPFHVARKRVSYVDSSGERVKPSQPNAVKFERFIFDLMPSAEGAAVVEIDPAEGFSPLKNAPGASFDTPEAVRAAMAAQHRRWLRAGGAHVADDVPVEICPLWALDAEDVAEKIAQGTRVTAPTYFR